MKEWDRELDQAIEKIGAEIRNLRRHLHKNPEPSGEEFATTKYLAELLHQAGIEFRIAPAGRGIIAEVPADSHQLRVAMRGDMDALHIHDQKEVEYRSQKPGLMHACGHDAHSSMIFGAAKALKAIEPALPWPCPWRAIFQPAEETARGAHEMIDAGAIESVDSIIALHVDPELPMGRVAIRPGEMTARCEDVRVIIHGEGGHAARPHQTIDPIMAAVHFVSDVYKIIPRSVDSRDPVVVSFGVIRGGDNANVIPEQVFLEGTIRTLSKKSSELVWKLLEDIRRGTSAVTRTKIEINTGANVDGVYNDHELTDVMWEAAAAVVGRDKVDFIPQPSMGAEDFASYLAKARGCLMRLGAAADGKPKHFLHSSRFDIDERALTIGSRILARTLVMLAKPKSRD